MRDEEFFRKLLERLVLRFQGSFAYLGNVKGYAEWSKTAQDIHRDHDNVAVRTMIQMIVYAVVEEVREIDKGVNAPDLLSACKMQHEAIDRLFAMLLEIKPGFFPSKSGQPWAAMMAGNAAIERAER